VLGQAPCPVPAPTVDSLLERFTHDLTRQAREGRIDPVLCRDAEIGQLIDILMRRRKNNPILVGEAGVGKTAVVEGLALRVVTAQVPEPLRDVRVLTLDMGLLQAGASIKGEFERRLKGVIDEVNASMKPVILFIDEAHIRQYSSQLSPAICATSLWTSRRWVSKASGDSAVSFRVNSQANRP